MIRAKTTGIGLLAAVGMLALGSEAMAQPYYPNMVYHPKKTLAEGVTWQRLTNASPAWSIDVFEVDMNNKNIELHPIFRTGGNTTSSVRETTSSMASRSDAVAAVNAGYFQVTEITDPPPGGTLNLTNSYTVIDGVMIGGNHYFLRPENNRSILGFSGAHQETPGRIIMLNTFAPRLGSELSTLNQINNMIGGRGRFITSGGVHFPADPDNNPHLNTISSVEGTGLSHYNDRHPRTMIGYTKTATEYKAYLVTVDGRQPGFSVGMSYDECGKLMADLGVEQSISLDGGGSTTAWAKGKVVNSYSDASERTVVSAWGVVPAQTMDNTSYAFSSTGTWVSDEALLGGNPPGNRAAYHQDHLIADANDGVATATWTPELNLDGRYKVYAWWVQDASRSTAVPVTINHADGTDNLTINQTTNGRQWNLLGTYNFEAGTSGSVTMSTAATGTVSADAVRFTRVRELNLLWKKNVGDFPWFQNDSQTRSFAVNQATGNVIVSSTTSGQTGIYVLDRQDGSQIRQLAGSSSLPDGGILGGLATTARGNIFATNLIAASGTHSIYHWPTEDAAAPEIITAATTIRMGDAIDAYEDPSGNMTVIVTGNQGTAPTRVRRYTRPAGSSTWSSAEITLSGSVASLRYVTIKQSGTSAYEIWMKSTTGAIRRYNSAGASLGTGATLPTGYMSNYYYGTDNGDEVEYYVAGPYSGATGTITLYDGIDGFSAESVTVSQPTANGNASGRFTVGGYNGQLLVGGGVTNNYIALYGSTEPALQLPLFTAIPNWELY